MSKAPGLDPTAVAGIVREAWAASAGLRVNFPRLDALECYVVPLLCQGNWRGDPRRARHWRARKGRGNPFFRALQDEVDRRLLGSGRVGEQG